MDKLEMALQKARQSRQAALREVPAIPALPETMPDARFGRSVGPAAAPAIPILPQGVRPEETYLERWRVVSHRTRHKDADSFRILRTQVLQLMTHFEHRSLAITSPNYGDGKSTIAFNLALSIAQDVKQTVLLVDLDLRKPSIHRYVGLEAPCGLSDHLINDLPLSECLYRPSFERLSILPAGRTLDNSSEVLGSPKMAALAAELEQRYHDRLLIYDMPPILAQDDSIAFFPHVGAVLLVVRDGVTRTNDVKRSINALAGAHFIGTVLNRPVN